MKAFFTHTLATNQDEVFEHRPSEYLALVDTESYPTFVSKEVDHLDMMAHLQNQMIALTAIAWGAPNKDLRIRMLVTENLREIERLAHAHHATSASGWVRTNGRLCFTSHDRLFACAQRRSHRLLRHEPLSENALPRIFNVPPGIYSVMVYYHFPFPYGGEITQSGHLSIEPKLHYTVVLHHYPFPQPRVAPVRLSGGLIPWAGEETASGPWGRAQAA